MKISDLGRATDTKPVTIRFYEKIGLLPPPKRTQGNYRAYNDAHVRRLRFIRRARDLGFEIEDVRSLLAMADDPDDATRPRVAAQHLRVVEHKISLLSALREVLAELANNRADPHAVELVAVLSAD